MKYKRIAAAGNLYGKDHDTTYDHRVRQMMAVIKSVRESAVVS